VIAIANKDHISHQSLAELAELHRREDAIPGVSKVQAAEGNGDG